MRSLFMAVTGFGPPDIYVSTHTRAYIYVYMYIYMYTCIYIIFTGSCGGTQLPLSGSVHNCAALHRDVAYKTAFVAQLQARVGSSRQAYTRCMWVVCVCVCVGSARACVCVCVCACVVLRCLEIQKNVCVQFRVCFELINTNSLFNECPL
jgi:hypothetical protein